MPGRLSSDFEERMTVASPDSLDANYCPRVLSIRTLGVLCHLRRNVSQFYVGVLRHALEDLQRLLLGNVLTLDEDAERNADYGAAGKSNSEFINFSS